MITVYIFKIAIIFAIFNIFKKFFERINFKISLMCCTETGAVYQNVLDSNRRMVDLTFQLIVSS